jgi:hypothetical protein
LLTGAFVQGRCAVLSTTMRVELRSVIGSASYQWPADIAWRNAAAVPTNATFDDAVAFVFRSQQGTQTLS